jgi:hypothetical protein
MNPFHTLTDEQLAEWHILHTKVERLTADLAESRKATEAVQVAAEEERQKLRAELAGRDNHIAVLLKLNALHQTALRRHAAALVETLTALRRLVAAITQAGEHHNTPEANAVLDKIFLEAQEVILRHDIPFGAEPLPVRAEPPAASGSCEKLRTDLDAARSNTRREKERVTALVNAAREFMKQIADHLKWHPGEDLNGETIRAWQDLQEACNAARPLSK